MTRTEQAAFRRLDNRRHELFTALGIIRTWIIVHGSGDQELLDRIAAFCHRKIEDERLAQTRESERVKGVKK